MTELEKLSEEVSNRPVAGVLKKKEYTPLLRRKVIAASLKYGRSNVARATGLTNSLITTWESRYASIKGKKGEASKKSRPIVIKELPNFTPSSSSFVEHNNNKPVLKLTSPNGFSLDININDEREIISIINAFLGGMR